MTDDTSRVPKLRFPGFTGAWEQRKFNDLFNPVRNNSLSRAMLNNFSGDVRSIHYGDVLIRYGAITDCRDATIPFISRSQSSDFSEELLNDGDVLFADAAEDQTVGKVTEVEGISGTPVVAGLHILACRPKVTMGLGYLAYYLNSPAFHGSLLPLMQGTKVLSISRSILAETRVYYPVQLRERQLLGTFFKQLDDLITLHQRKLSHLRELKRGLLQKMFPKSGEDRPEVRFPGFADAWEQRKLRDYLVPSKDKNSALSYGKDEVLSVSGDAGVVNQIQFQGRSYAGASTKDYGVVQTGDVIYTKSPLKKNPFGIIKTNKGKAGIVSTLYAVYKPKDNTYTPFVEVYFDDDARLNNYLRPLVNKGAKNDMKVSKSGALTGLICFPGATEQRMLSEFFQQLEDLITLHQRKLSHLQQQKKALLQQMFV